MRYLFDKDYFTVQDAQLNQLIQGNKERLYKAENAALEEFYSYLTQRFDTSGEFTDTAVWNPATIYYPGDRVYLDAATFDVTKPYSVNDVTLLNGNVYIALFNLPAGVFNVANWQLMGKQNDMYYAKYPFPNFNINGSYNIGDEVYWKHFTYIATSASQIISAEDAIQYVSYSNIPLSNVFPDSLANSNGQFWGTKTAYSVPAFTSILDATKWVKGDNRSAQTVLYAIDIAMYHLHAALAPTNIPELRVKRYDDACKWLRRVSLGEITTTFPVKQPTQGLKRRYGGHVKTNNVW